MFGMDYMYMNSKANNEEFAHPILVIKDRMSGGAWVLPITRKGTYLPDIVQRLKI